MNFAPKKIWNGPIAKRSNHTKNFEHDAHAH